MENSKKEYILCGVFAAIVIVMSILSPDRFLSLYNVQTMAFQLPEFGIIALGMMMVILTGGINLSITAGSALAGIMAAFILSGTIMAGSNIVLAIAVAIGVILLTSVLIGLLNGFVVAYIGVTPILVTLGSQILYEGISMWLTKGGAISNFPEAYYWFGNESIGPIPVPLIIFVIIAVVTYILLEKTPWGARVYMVGSNPTAAIFSGIDIKRILMQVYVYWRGVPR